MKKVLINFELTGSQLEKELKREKQRHSRKIFRMCLLLSLVFISAVAVLVATIWFPVLSISGNSMEPSLESGQLVLTYRTDKCLSGDLIVFYHDNRILVRRVIASAGDWINIESSGQITVNGQPLTEKSISGDVLALNDRTYPYQVPDNSLFVLSDNLSAAVDSRVLSFGCVDTERIIGKVIFRIWPFRRLEYLG